MKILSRCEPFFVRCIKPNIMQKPMVSRGTELRLISQHTGI